ncbi:MAG: hypothetical protein ACYTX0_48380 [Nostoc sp.]
MDNPKITDPFGDRYWQLPSTLEITAELEMSKASYFRARARLQELELFDSNYVTKCNTFTNLGGLI